MKNLYISISGVLGSGKTTLVQFLSQQLGFHFFEENVSENVFLPKYYQDPKTWAVHSQLFYLQEKVLQLMKMKDLLATTSVIQDSPIYQDCFTYAKAQYVLGYMSNEEHQLYMRFFNLVQRELPVPDLIIQLDTLPSAIEERIQRRGREYEKSIDQSYIELLARLQNEWLAEYAHLPIIRLQADNEKFDLIHNSLYQQQLLDNIKSAVNWRT